MIVVFLLFILIFDLHIRMARLGPPLPLLFLFPCPHLYQWLVSLVFTTLGILLPICLFGLCLISCLLCYLIRSVHQIQKSFCIYKFCTFVWPCFNFHKLKHYHFKHLNFHKHFKPLFAVVVSKPSDISHPCCHRCIHPFEWHLWNGLFQAEGWKIMCISNTTFLHSFYTQTEGLTILCYAELVKQYTCNTISMFLKHLFY